MDSQLDLYCKILGNFAFTLHTVTLSKTYIATITHKLHSHQVIYLDWIAHELRESRAGNFIITVQNVKTDPLFSEPMMKLPDLLVLFCPFGTVLVFFNIGICIVGPKIEVSQDGVEI